MTLIELLNEANKVYPDNYLSEFYTSEGKLNQEGSGDTLAKFIVAELIETFEESQDTEDQLQNAVDQLWTASETISELIRHLDKKLEELLAVCPKCHGQRSKDCDGDYRCEVCDKPCPGCDDGGMA